MRPSSFAVAFLILTASVASAEYRLVSDVISTGAVDGQGGSYRLRGTLGESAAGTVNEPPWFLQQGFWFVWRGVVGIPDIPAAVPPRTYDLRLDQNAPNPFNPVTRIPFVVPGESGERVSTRLDIVDVRGRLVHTLVNEQLSPGAHEVTWSGNNRDGQIVGSGVYFYRLRTGDQSARRQLVILK